MLVSFNIFPLSFFLSVFTRHLMLCSLVSVYFLQAEAASDEVYAQVSLVPDEVSCIPILYFI